MFICLFLTKNTAYSFLLWQAPIKLCAILDAICVYCTCPCCLRDYFHWLCCFNCTAGESVPEKVSTAGLNTAFVETHCGGGVQCSILCFALWYFLDQSMKWGTRSKHNELEAGKGAWRFFLTITIGLHWALLMLHDNVQHNIKFIM